MYLITQTFYLKYFSISSFKIIIFSLSFSDYYIIATSNAYQNIYNVQTIRELQIVDYRIDDTVKEFGTFSKVTFEDKMCNLRSIRHNV